MPTTDLHIVMVGGGLTALPAAALLARGGARGTALAGGPPAWRRGRGHRPRARSRRAARRRGGCLGPLGPVRRPAVPPAAHHAAALDGGDGARAAGGARPAADPRRGTGEPPAHEPPSRDGRVAGGG